MRRCTRHAFWGDRRFRVTEVFVPGRVAIALLGDTVRPCWWVSLTIGLLLAVAGRDRAGPTSAMHRHAHAGPTPRWVGTCGRGQATAASARLG